MRNRLRPGCPPVLSQLLFFSPSPSFYPPKKTPVSHLEGGHRCFTHLWTSDSAGHCSCGILMACQQEEAAFCCCSCCCCCCCCCLLPCKTDLSSTRGRTVSRMRSPHGVGGGIKIPGRVHRRLAPEARSPAAS